MKDDEEEKLKY